MCKSRPICFPSAMVAQSAMFGGSVPTAFASESNMPQSTVRVETAPVRNRRGQNSNGQDFGFDVQQDPPGCLA